MAGETRNVISGTEAGETINGTVGDDVIRGLGGDDRLLASLGNDRLDGGAGNDYLEGGEGSDTYFFGLGSGQDRISNYGLVAVDVDKVVLGAGIDVDDVMVRRMGDDLQLLIVGSSDTLVVSGHFRAPQYAMDRIQFADGTMWNLADINSRLWATAGDDLLYGSSGDDVIKGLGGTDRIVGQEGNDKLDGGTGNDFLEGGTGSDTYFFGLGYGLDVVSNLGAATTDIDKVVLGAGIDTGDVFMHALGQDLLVALNATDRLIISGYFHDRESQMDRIQFADGTVWKYADVASFLDSTPFNDNYHGTEFDDVRHGQGGDDYIFGQGGNDKLYGDAGSDFLLGEEGNDRLDGGAGNDWLIGGNGSNTYIFGLGSGQDVIDNYSGDVTANEKILLGAGIDADDGDVILTRSGSDLVVQIAGTTDKMTVHAHFANDLYSINRIQFADGTIWNEAFILGAVEATSDIVVF